MIIAELKEHVGIHRLFPHVYYLNLDFQIPNNLQLLLFSYTVFRLGAKIVIDMPPFLGVTAKVLQATKK